jgi:hypothetical protein
VGGTDRVLNVGANVSRHADSPQIDSARITTTLRGAALSDDIFFLYEFFGNPTGLALLAL